MSTDTPPAPKPETDWETIEREYRAGQLSVHQIARQQGISHTAINKRAKRDGWTRDLSAKVRAEVSARLVSTGVSAEGVKETIQAAAERGVALVREHREDIKANRAAVVKLLADLHQTIDYREEIEEEIIADTETSGGDENKADDREKLKRRARMMAAVALPANAQVASTLATALKTLIPLERQALNLDAAGNPPPDGSEGSPVHVSLTDASATKLLRLLE